MSEKNDGEMLRYFIMTLSPSRRFPFPFYYIESPNFGYSFIVVKSVLETSCIKQSIALRDHCFDTTPLL